MQRREGTERVSTAVTLFTCIREVICSNPDRNFGYLKLLPGFLQQNAGIILRIGHDRFIRKPFQFVSDLATRHSDYVVKQTTNEQEE